MKQNTVNQLCIGIDLGDRYSHLCALDLLTGKMLEESRIPTSRRAFESRFAQMPPTRLAIEVGSHSRWVSQLLEGAGHQVIVANSRKLRLIYCNDSKSDRVDAQYLARLAAADPSLLHPVQHRREEDQATRALLVARDRLVGCRTKLVNLIRGMAKAAGERLPSVTACAFHNRMSAHIPEQLRPAVQPLLETLAFLHKKIRTYDKEISRLCTEAYPQTQRLMQIKGVGPITALDYVVTVSDPLRFSTSRVAGAFLGLRPRKKSSGKGDPELRITKSGDRMLRSHVVQSAQYILGPFGEDCDLRRWGLKLAARGGKNAKKRAVVAVARKLAVLMHRLWVTGQDYEPLRNANKTGAVVATV